MMRIITSPEFMLGTIWGSVATAVFMVIMRAVG